ARDAAEERRGRIIGMPLDLGRGGQDFIGRSTTVYQFAQPKPRYRRRGTAAETPPLRDFTSDLHDQRRRPPSTIRRPRPECRLDSIGPPKRTIHKPAFEPS